MQRERKPGYLCLAGMNIHDPILQRTRGEFIKAKVRKERRASSRARRGLGGIMGGISSWKRSESMIPESFPHLKDSGVYWESQDERGTGIFVFDREGY